MSRPESRTRSRTRAAILAAAATVFAHDRAASLATVAAAAGVGRTTLHRYYPDRASLVLAIAMDSVAATEEAIRRSDTDHGTAIDALARLLPELLALGDRYGFLLDEPEIETDAEYRHADRVALAPIECLLARGRDAGEFRRDHPIAWQLEMLGMAIFGAWRACARGDIAASDAERLVRETVFGFLLPPRATSYRPLNAR